MVPTEEVQIHSALFPKMWLRQLPVAGFARIRTRVSNRPNYGESDYFLETGPGDENPVFAELWFRAIAIVRPRLTSSGLIRRSDLRFDKLHIRIHRFDAKNDSAVLKHSNGSGGLGNGNRNRVRRLGNVGRCKVA